MGHNRYGQLGDGSYAAASNFDLGLTKVSTAQQMRQGFQGQACLGKGLGSSCLAEPCSKRHERVDRLPPQVLPNVSAIAAAGAALVRIVATVKPI